ncbi:MAG: hypothetical protein ACRC6I_09290, partial [Paracoccaceae bacterium]
MTIAANRDPVFRITPRAKKPPHIRVDGGGKARIWLGGQVGQPEGHHLGTDAAPFAQIAGNS